MVENLGVENLGVETVGIVGAGQMGSGIAHVFALNHIKVVLMDIDQECLDRGLASITRNLERLIAKDAITAADKDEALGLITPGAEYGALSGCDLVIEAVFEDEAAKCAVYEKLTPHLAPDAILATNTSSISITRLAAASGRPGKFIGMHFMNPVPVMKLVELIRGIATEDDTFETVRALTEKLGKTPVSAEDYPGFMVNRILLPMINEAIYTLYEGVGNVEAIDNSMKLGANHPMGPLELADFIGLDTCLEIMQVLYDGLADSKYRPCPLLVKYVDAGWLGRKSGRGFYDYSAKTPVPTR